MADIIQVHYDVLNEVQNRLQKQAEAVETINNSIKRQVNQLSQNWVGSAATSFFNEIQSEIYPAFNRLNHVLGETAIVTGQIATTFRQAEEQAAKLFHNPFEDMVVAPPQAKPDNGIIGWLSNTAREAGKAAHEAGKAAWNFIEDHRDQIAFAGAVIAAGVATVATGGAASPFLIAALGAGAAGGITLAVNGASAKYPWHDGLLKNTFNGAMTGFGIGSGFKAGGVLLDKIGAVNDIVNKAIDYKMLPQALKPISDKLGILSALHKFEQAPQKAIEISDKIRTAVPSMANLAAQHTSTIEKVIKATAVVKGIRHGASLFNNQLQPSYAGGGGGGGW